MIRSLSSAISFVRGLWRDKRGSFAVIAGITLPVLLGLSGLTLDMGNVLRAQSQLRAMTDAAAMAGANALTLPGGNAASAIQAVTDWTKANPVPNLQMVNSNVATSCVTTIAGLPNCSPGDTTHPNVVTVSQQGTVPALLAKLVGFKGPFTVSAAASAAKAGGTTNPLNIMFVLDATPSMSTTPPAGQTLTCTGSTLTLTGSNLTPENCALYAIQQIMQVMLTPQDKIGLAVFPGYVSTPPVNPGNPPGGCATYPAAAKYFTTTPTKEVYTIVPLSNDYLSSPGIMKASSNLVRAVGTGTASGGCFRAQQAVTSPKYDSYMAGSIAEAQANLAAASVTGTQNVMIVLSDGQMNLKSTDVATNKWTPAYPAGINSGNGQCSQSVTEAGNAKAAGTLVYSVAYVMHGETGGNTKCTGDTYTPCTQMMALASDPTRFFTTDTVACGQNTTNLAADLPAIMKQIATTLHKARLIPAS